MWGLELHERITELERELCVSEYFDDFLFTVQEKYQQEKIDDLRKKMEFVQLQWNQVDWSTEINALKSDKETLSLQFKELQEHFENLTGKCSVMTNKIGEWETIIRQPKPKSNALCELIPNARVLMCSFLEIGEVRVLLSVSKQFKESFDVGFIWRSFIQRDICRIRNDPDNIIVPVSKPMNVEFLRSISITLEEKTKTLTKDGIFSRALESLAEQIHECSSEREDLSNRLKTSGTVTTFLKQKLDELQEKISVSRVILYKQEILAKEMLAEKNSLVEEMTVEEKKSEELDKKYLVKSVEYAEAEKSLDIRLSTFSMLHAELENPENEITQLKQQKKLLVKEVKTLRSEITSLSSDRDAKKLELEKLQIILRNSVS